MKKISIFLIILLTLVLTSCCQPTPTETPSVEPPASTEETAAPETSTSAESQISELEVKWKECELSDNDANRAVVIDDDEGEVVYAIGSIPDNFRDIYVWRTEDGGATWERLGLITDQEIQFKNKEEIYERWFKPAAVTLEWEPKKDPNNPNIILKPEMIPGLVKIEDPNNPDVVKYEMMEPPHSLHWIFLLSFDGGQSWSKVNLPPPAENDCFGMLTVKYDLVSVGGVLKIFFAHSEIWQATISLPNQEG